MATTTRTTRMKTTTTDTNKMARGINIALGVWLFISAFLWLHTDSQFTNTWLVGLGIAGVAAVGLGAPQIRWLNALLAAWLIVSVFALPTLMGGTFWNNLLVGVASLIVSLMPFATTQRRYGATHRTTHQRTTHRSYA